MITLHDVLLSDDSERKANHTANYFRVEAGEFNKAYWVVNLYFKGKLYTRRRVKDEEAARAKAEMWRNWD